MRICCCEKSCLTVASGQWRQKNCDEHVIICTDWPALLMFAVRVWLHEIMQSFYDVVVLLTQRELSGSSLICVKSVKIADKDLALSDCYHEFLCFFLSSLYNPVLCFLTWSEDADQTFKSKLNVFYLGFYKCQLILFWKKNVQGGSR